MAETLEEFTGYVTKIEDGTAYVDLRIGEDLLYGHASEDWFAAHGLAGIAECSQFKGRTAEREDGEVIIELEHVPDREITAEEIASIKAKIEAVLGTDDPGVVF